MGQHSKVDRYEHCSWEDASSHPLGWLVIFLVMWEPPGDGRCGLILVGFDSLGHPPLHTERRLRDEGIRGLAMIASLQNGPRQVSPDFGPSDEQVRFVLNLLPFFLSFLFFSLSRSGRRYLYMRAGIGRALVRHGY